MRIYPSPGLLVRDPVKQDFLPEEGREVPDGAFYWLRRLSCQDVTLTQPAAVSAPAIVEVKAIQSTPSDGSDKQ
jgi:hypothetical protein